MPSQCVGIVIGRSGETIRDLQQRSGAHIKVTPDRDANDDDPVRVIYISGTPASLELAQSLVNDVINEGLTRSYRDGIEPQSISEQQEAGAQDDSYEPANERGEFATRASDGRDGPRPEETEGNGADPGGADADGEAASDEQRDGTGNTDEIDYTNSAKFPELSAGGREAKSVQNGNEVHDDEDGPGEGNTKVAGDVWVPEEDGDGEEQGETSDAAPESNKPDTTATGFTGEGRLVQRPATDYPSASISYEMKIPHAKVGVIIGKKGSTIRALQQKSGARIVVSKKIDTSREDNPRAVTITGPEPFVVAARRLIIARINPPGDQSNPDDKDLPIDSLDLDDALLSEDTGIDSLALDMANHSLSSPLPPMMRPGSPSPISPVRVPQNPPYGPYQRQMPFVGPNPTMQFAGIPQYRDMRSVMRPDAQDYRPLELQAHQPTQYTGHFMGPQHFAERMQLAHGFSFPQSPEGGETLQPGFPEYRPDQFYPPTGTNFASVPFEGAGNYVPEQGAQVGQTFPTSAAPEFAGDEATYSYPVEEYEQQSADAGSAA